MLLAINDYLLHNGLLAVLDIDTLGRCVNTLTVHIIPVTGILAIDSNTLDTS